MATDYAGALFHWRKHAGALDAGQPKATMSTMLWACDKWLEANEGDASCEIGQRIGSIRKEIVAWFDSFGK